jgi:hypothetical protein
MGMPLRAVANDGYLLGLNEGEVGIVIVIGLGHDFLCFPLLSWLRFLCDGLDRLSPQSIQC